MSEGRSSSWVPNELRWLTRQIRPFLHLHLGSFLCITAGSLLGILTPLVLKWMIDRVIPGKQTGLLLLATALIFLSSQGKTVATNLGGYLMLTAAQRMSLELRMSLLRHLDSLSADYYESTPVGTVIYPLREPIDEIAYFGSDLVPAILRTLLTTGFTLATMFTLSPVLTVVIVPFIPVFLLARQYFRKQLAATSDIVQRDLSSWCSFLEEHVAAAIPVQLLGRQRQQERRAFRLLAWTVRSQQQLFRTGIWFTLSTSLAIVLAMSAVVGYGGWRVIAGTLSLGSLVAFYSFVTQLFDPLSGAAELYSRAQKTFASVRQIQTVMAVRPSVVDAPDAIDFPPKAPAQIDFVGVQFGYERKKGMLQIPSLRVAEGEHVAIAGENGAGKSTLAKLIARIYDVDCGTVRIGGEDVRNLRLANLRRCVSYLPRDPALFDGTVAFNLKFVRPMVPDQEVWKVVECTGLSDLIRGLPNGLHQSVGPGACQLSGGERQRLALARALLQQPEILILDEATSCLDQSSETTVLQNIGSYLRKSTVIVISHRLTTLSIFSRVVVLSEGRIVRDEKPDALLPCGSTSSKLFHPPTATAD
jgi:ABC-type bacteriocin/lantibiotic exporter with double-glycine peptidase domain